MPEDEGNSGVSWNLSWCCKEPKLEYFTWKEWEKESMPSAERSEANTDSAFFFFF